MNKRLILTVSQARELQIATEANKHNRRWRWPGSWEQVYNQAVPMDPHRRAHTGRDPMAIWMLEEGCTTEQVAAQMNLITDCELLKQIVSQYQASRPNVDTSSS